MILRGLILTTVAALLASGAVKERAEATHSETFEIPAGGSLRMVNTAGDVMIEGWDRPNVEITTLKWTLEGKEELEKAGVKAKRDGNDLVVTTEVPRHAGLKPVLRGGARVDLQYRIKVPTGTPLHIQHDEGSISIANIQSDMQVRVGNGDVTLFVVNPADYSIDAKVKFGGVTSNFDGKSKRELWLVGERFGRAADGKPHHAEFRVGYGDVLILKSTITP